MSLQNALVTSEVVVHRDETISLEAIIGARRSLPLTKEELGEEEPELSRTNKGNISNQTKSSLKTTTR